MSSTIHVRVSDQLKEFVASQTEQDFETPSEYIRHLIRKDKEDKELAGWGFLKRELMPGILAKEDEFVEVSADEVLQRCHARVNS